MQKKAFITGSSRGIGRSMALALAKQGYDILLHYRREREAADAVAKEITTLGRKCWIYQADLCSDAETTKMLDVIIKEHATLDVYIANAASTAFKSLCEQNTGNVLKTLQLVLGSFLTSVQKLRPLLAGRDAQILTISGIDTVKYCPGHGLLAAAKSALETLTKYLTVELAQEKIHCKCFNPGLVQTDSTRIYMGEAFDDVCAAANATAPHKGFATADDVAAIAIKILNSDMNWMAGNTFYADGGLGFMLPVFRLQA